MTGRAAQGGPEEKRTKTALCSLSALSTRHHIDSINWQFCRASTEADGGSDGETAAAFGVSDRLYLCHCSEAQTALPVSAWGNSTRRVPTHNQPLNGATEPLIAISDTGRFRRLVAFALSRVDRFQWSLANNLCTQKLIRRSLLASAIQPLPFRRNHAGASLRTHRTRALALSRAG